MELDKAKTIYDGLQTDIQTHIMKEYIEPQLKCDDLIKSFHTLIESEVKLYRIDRTSNQNY